MARQIGREIEALLGARVQQIPHWHDFVEHGEHGLSMADHIQLLHHLLAIHAELIVRLAQEIEAVQGV